MFDRFGAMLGANLGPKLGPNWAPNRIQIGPQTASNLITHSMLFLKPSWTVLDPFMNGSWRSGRANFERPSNGFEVFYKLQASLIKRRWSVFQGPLEPHLGASWGAILGPSWTQDGASLHVHVGIKC